MKSRIRSADGVENPYEVLFRKAPSPLYRTSPDGTVLDVNRAMVRLLGYPDRETLLRMNAADVYVDPRARNEWRQQLETTEGEVTFTMQDRRYDGQVIEVEDVSRAIRDRDGKILWFQGMLRRIDGLRPSEDEAQRAEASMLGEEAIWCWERTSSAVVWSRSLATVFGHDPARPGRAMEQSYRWWRNHVHPSDRDRAATVFHGVVAGGGGGWQTRYRFRRADGQYVEVLDRGQVSRDEEGHVVRLEGRLIDLDRSATASSVAEAAGLRRPPVPPTADTRLVEWIESGSEWAFEALWERHAASLLADIRARTGSRVDAEEVVMDAFVQAWSTAGSYDPMRGTVGAWLQTIARSRAQDRLRKQHRRRNLMGSAPRDGVLQRSTESCGEDVLRRTTLQDAVRGLPPEQRRAVHLSFMQGLTHAEIAARLDIPLGTVKYRIRAGLARIREHL